MDNEPQYLFDQAALDELLRNHANAKIEEIAAAVQRFAFPFGKDTVDSFAVFIRSMKE